MLQRKYSQKLTELFYITDMKRVKAEESGYYVEADDLNKTQDYLELVNLTLNGENSEKTHG